MESNIFQNFLKVFQGSFGGGVLTDLGTFKKVNMMDRFFLGGPMTLRGFQSRGIGNLNENFVAGVTVMLQKRFTEVHKNNYNLKYM